MLILTLEFVGKKSMYNNIIMYYNNLIMLILTLEFAAMAVLLKYLAPISLSTQVPVIC